MAGKPPRARLRYSMRASTEVTKLQDCEAAGLTGLRHEELRGKEDETHEKDGRRDVHRSEEYD
jgi:hypothetical protein